MSETYLNQSEIDALNKWKEIYREIRNFAVRQGVQLEPATEAHILLKSFEILRLDSPQQ